jgi:hypothetical protein
VFSGVQSVNKEEVEDKGMMKRISDFYFRPAKLGPVQASGSVQLAIGWPRNPT